MVGAALHVDAEVCKEDASLRIACLFGHAVDMSCLDLLFGLVDQVFHGFRVIKAVHELLLEDGDGDVQRLHCDLGEGLEVRDRLVVHGSLAGAHLLFVLDDVLGVVGDSFKVIYDLDQSVELVQVLGREVERAKLYQLSEDGAGQIIDGLLALHGFLSLLGVMLEEAVQRVLHVVVGKAGHSADFAVRVVHGDSGRNLGGVGEIDQLLILYSSGLFFGFRDQPAGELDDEIRYRSQDQNGDDREDRVRVRDLTGDVVRRQTLDKGQDLREDRDQAQDQDRPEGVEQKVEQRAALAVSVCRKACQKVGRDGADCRADDQVDGDLVADDILHGEGLEDDGRGG